MTVVLTFVVAVALFLTLLWLLFGNRRPKTDATLAALEIKKLLPAHCRHFPQVQRALRSQDEEFIDRRAPRYLAKRWRAERRQVVHLYIRGLAQDFRGLEQLARLIAMLSPDIRRKQEWEWLWLGIQFRLLYRMTLLRFALHSLPSDELMQLTEMLTGLAAGLEHSLDRLMPKLAQVKTTTI
ncbi:MAG TPA: hypothetical protein VKB26_03600 [Candidatus Acidoferrales bacterium]|nr:hypothetical protein [Candidatus Acidoferrales bacterium]